MGLLYPIQLINRFFIAIVLLLVCNIACAQDDSEYQELACIAPLEFHSEFDPASLVTDFYAKLRHDLLLEKDVYHNKVNISCLVAMEDIASQSTKKPVFIDVREPVNRSSVGFMDVLHIPLSELKVKAFLKKKNIVLLSEGYNDLALTEYCNVLKKAGFLSVHVLKGGLTSWLLERQGIAKKDKAIESINAKDFYAAKYKSRWLIIDLTGRAPPEPIENLIALDVKTFDKEGVATIMKVANNLSHGYVTQPDILIIGQTAVDHQKVIDRLPVNYRPDTYVMDGGIEAYQRFIAHHQKILSQKHLAANRRPTCRARR